MAGTFGTLMLADLSTLKQIGFALGVGVLLDTFLVRPLLVPAFLLLMWKEADPVAVRKRMLLEKERGATIYSGKQAADAIGILSPLPGTPGRGLR